MVEATQIQPNMEIVGADGVHLGIVDHMDGDRVKVKRKDLEHGVDLPHHHYIPLANIADIYENKVWLSADADNANQLFEEKDGSPIED